MLKILKPGFPKAFLLLAVPFLLLARVSSAATQQAKLTAWEVDATIQPSTNGPQLRLQKGWSGK